MFENVNGDDAVKETVGEVEGLLAVADDGLDAGENSADVGRHVLTEFIGVVILLLFGGEFLVVDVFAEAGADFESGFKAGLRKINRERVVELLNHAVAVGKLLVPELHELVTALLLFWRENGKNFWPLGCLHKIREKGEKRVAGRRKLGRDQLAITKLGAAGGGFRR